MHATKHEGAGNDFLVVLDPDDAVRFSVAQVRLLADRRRGIGADGIIRVGPGRGGCDLSMQLHNADGSEAEMSGNGIRCLAQAAVGAGLVSPPSFTVATAGGRRTVEYAPGLPRDGRLRGWTWGLPGWALTNPRSSTTAGSARSTSAIHTWCCSDRTRPASTSPSSVPSCRPALPAASTWSGSPWRATRRASSSTSGCGSAGWARRSPAAPGAWPLLPRHAAGARRGDGTVRVRNPGGILEVTLGADDQATTYLAGPVRKVADVDIHPGLLS